MNVLFVWWLLLVVAQISSLVDANWITGNLCWSMPCLNGGSCFGSAYTYLCVCPINYSGALCEKRLGICQESPCGNRGLCVETGLFSFECRCYFDYMGPLCEEHVPKTDTSIWSSLIPVHTRVLLDILQEAYRAKARDKATTDSNNMVNDPDGLFTTQDTTFSSMVSTATTMTLESNPTTEIEHTMPVDGLKLERIFPHTSDSFTSDMSTQVSSTIETTQQEDYKNETTLSKDTTSVTAIDTTENISTTLLPSTTVGVPMTVSVEQNQTNYSDTTELDSTQMTSASSTWSNNNQTTDYTTELVEDSTAQISNNTELDEFDQNTTTSSETYESSNPTDYNAVVSSEPSIPTSIDPSNAHHQLLLKLCQQLLSHILPNVTSLSTSAALQAALSLSSNSGIGSNQSTDALLLWIKEQLSSTTRFTTTESITTTTITTTTTTTTVISSTISSSLPPLLINDKKFPFVSLQRVDMDDVLHQMNNNIDGDN